MLLNCIFFTNFDTRFLREQKILKYVRQANYLLQNQLANLICPEPSWSVVHFMQINGMVIILFCHISRFTKMIILTRNSIVPIKMYHSMLQHSFHYPYWSSDLILVTNIVEKPKEMAMYFSLYVLW